MNLSTCGKIFYAGREAGLRCIFGLVDFLPEAYKTRYQAVHVKDGFGILRIGGRTQLITAPALLCLNEKEQPQWIDSHGISMDILFFHPSFYKEAYHFDYPWKVNDSYPLDAWSIRPFIERHEHSIGTIKISWLLSKRISQLMHQTDEELTIQRDRYWPCRSRSFFVELLILAGSIYDDGKICNALSMGTLSEDIHPIIQYLHAGYPEKITLMGLTKRFHTNKTTLSTRFKSETGMTVMDYLNHLRIEIACSMLKNTALSVNEILRRVGFKDAAHFGRVFKKFTGISPSEYRNP